MPERNSFEDFSLLRSWSIHIQRYNFATAFCEGKTVLDAGCGIGYGSYELLRRGARHVIGFDYSNEALSEARRHYGQFKELEFCQGDLHAFRDSFDCERKIDILVHLENLEHLEYPQQFYQQVTPLLTREENHAVKCIVSTPNGEITERDEKGAIKNEFHVHEMTASELNAFLGSFFRSVEIYGQWQTPEGKSREGRDRAVFEQLISGYWSLPARVDRFIRMLVGRRTLPPPIYTGAAETYANEHVIELLDSAPFPWPPMYLLAVCRDQKVGVD